MAYNQISALKQSTSVMRDHLAEALVICVGSCYCDLL